MGFRNRLTVHWGYSGHGWPDIFAPGGPLVHPGPEPAGPAAPAQHGCAVPGQSGGRRPQLRVPGVPGHARQDAPAAAPAPEHAGGLSSAAEGEAVRLLQGAPAAAEGAASRHHKSSRDHGGKKDYRGNMDHRGNRDNRDRRDQGAPAKSGNTVAKHLPFENHFGKAKFGESPHNTYPSNACDTLPMAEGKYVWDNKELHKVYAKLVMDTAWSQGFKWKWGGDFSSFYDGPHFERIE